MAVEQGEAAKRRRGPGRPFPKGVSGNPKGRPATNRVLTKRLQEALAENDEKRARALILGLLRRAADGKVDAIKVVFDRIEGKVAQPIVGDEGAPIAVTLQLGSGPAKTPKEMTDAELEAAMELLADDGDSEPTEPGEPGAA